MEMTQPNPSKPAIVRQKVRLRFRKQGDLRHIGHLDLLRTLERLFRRAGLNLSMTEGFHPKPRLSFPNALALGVEGVDEVMELELAEAMTAEEVLAALAPVCPPGLAFHSAEVLVGKGKSPVARVTYELPIPAAREEQLAGKIRDVLASSSLPIRRAGREAPIDLRPVLEELVLADGTLRFTLKVEREAGVRPREVLALVGVEDLELEGSVLARTAVELKS